MKLFAPLIVALLVAGLCANADPLNKWRAAYIDTDGNTYYAIRDGREMVIDTIYAAVGDTVTVRRAETAEGISIGFSCDLLKGATDSLAVYYRPVFLDSWTGIGAGSAWVALEIHSATGASDTLIDWTPGCQYWAEPFAPVDAPLQQFLFTTGTADTVRVTAVIRQIKTASFR